MALADPVVLSVTILNTASLSDAAKIGTGRLAGIILPTFTSAALSFQVSEDGTTYREAYDSSSTLVAVSASTGDRYIDAPAALAGANYIKVRSGTAVSPVTQGADRVIKLVVKR